MKIKQIAAIKTGYPFRGKIEESISSNVVAVQMKDTSPTTGVSWETCVKTQLEGKREPYFLMAGDILFAARGNSNYSTLIDEHIGNNQAVASPHFYIISITQKNIMPEYLVWFLNQTPCQRYFDSSSEGTLTKSIRRSVLEETKVAIPELKKQHAIIELAKALNNEQQLIQRLIQNGEILMSAIANDLMNNI